MIFDKKRMRFSKRNYDYEAGYRDGSTNYELEYCPACKNVADLQEALDENAKLRALVKDMWPFIKDPCPDRECCLFEECDADSERVCHVEEHMAARMRELGIEED